MAPVTRSRKRGYVQPLSNEQTHDDSPSPPASRKRKTAKSARTKKSSASSRASAAGASTSSAGDGPGTSTSSGGQGSKYRRPRRKKRAVRLITPLPPNPKPLDYMTPTTLDEEAIGELDPPPEVLEWLDEEAAEKTDSDVEHRQDDRDAGRVKRRRKEDKDEPAIETEEGRDPVQLAAIRFAERVQSHELISIGSGVHKPLAAFACDRCSSRFAFDVDLHWHRMTHSFRARRLIRCRVCNTPFLDLREAVMHANRRTLEGSCACYRCCICKQTFTDALRIRHKMVTIYLGSRVKGRHVVCHLCNQRHRLRLAPNQ